MGLAIGFGEFYLAATFMASSSLIIFITPFINKIFRSKKMSRQLQLVIERNDIDMKAGIYANLHSEGILFDEKKITLKDELVEITLEIVFTEKKVEWIQNYLLHNKMVSSFSF